MAKALDLRRRRRRRFRLRRLLLNVFFHLIHMFCLFGI